MIHSRPLYSSSNGDHWSLIRDTDSQTLLVRHVPNPASGGRTSIIEFQEFLGQHHSPQHRALLDMIGTLVTEGSTDA